MISETKIKPFKVPHVARHEEVACDLRRLEGFLFLRKEVNHGNLRTMSNMPHEAGHKE
jgi:hypothetical protein